ncbi:uncharacterized protein LOC109708139 isoform X1 [Ananas comosus]|uniref:Uncharacterized protein LOC109708139 isoform X1 n=1 Tax=Ananas comosus TaxID=4615 RepID=A0A6P5EVP2_ANACO|nr:uncharacterized protein LOC109708139 isoform X1 [Ananas comosus]
MAHTSGRKSYARKRKEMELALGKEPDRLTFWEVTHKKKNGNFVNKDAENSLDLARAKFVTLSQGSESDTNKLMDKAFLDIMGPEHNGRVKGLGLGPTLRSYYGVKHTNLPTTSESREGQPGEVEKLKEEMQEMRDELHRLKTLFSDTILLNSRVC